METNSQLKFGFTLVELSIVLVIIGLIIGGVLVGQDLIRAAEIRATVSQMEKYNAAVNTFRVKYGGLPGDLIYSQASAYGFFAFSGVNAGSAGFGDGNGLLSGTFPSVFEEGETFVFWRHLSDAQLITGSFATAGCPIDPVSGLVNFTTMSSLDCLFPSAKLGHGNYIIVFAGDGIVYPSTGVNYFQILGLSSNSGVLNNNSIKAMTPIETRNIDAKMDDGNPLGGRVRAMVDYYVNSTPGDNCTVAIAGGAAAYDVGTVNGNSPTCELRLQFQ